MVSMPLIGTRGGNKNNIDVKNYSVTNQSLWAHAI